MEGTYAADIERPQTEVEKQDFILLGTKTIYDVFNEALAKKVQEYAKKFMPFDEHCARLDFADKIEKASRESQRVHGFVRQDMKVNIDDINFDKYADPKRFELVEDQEALQDKVIEGVRTQVIMGHTLSYRCKERGHGLAVWVSNDEYKSRQEVKEKK